VSSEIFGAGFAALPEGQRLQRVAQELEAVVLTQLLSAMRTTVTESDMLEKAPGHDVFRSLLDGELARETARRSPFGLADAIVGQFEKAIKSAAGNAEQTNGPAATPPVSPPTGPEPSPSRSWRI